MAYKPVYPVSFLFLNPIDEQVLIFEIQHELLPTRRLQSADPYGTLSL
jgi:hypothetical protein